MTEREPPPEDSTRTDLMRAALHCLARREYSRQELCRKLVRKIGEQPSVEVILDELAERGLQSDHRFAEALVDSRVRRGQGAVRIRQELVQAGVAAELIDAALERAEVDWVALAADVCRRKFRSGSVSAWPDRARRARFLGQRGFDGDVIRAALAIVEQGAAR